MAKTLDELFDQDMHFDTPSGLICQLDRFEQIWTSEPHRVTCINCLKLLAQRHPPLHGFNPQVDLEPAEMGGGDGLPIGQVAPGIVHPVASPPSDTEVTTRSLLGLMPFGYIYGAAGSGKTHLARLFAKERSDVLFCATTGIAAVNLGDATTINSALSYFDTASLEEHYANGFLAYRMRRLRSSGVRILLIDEVSMMEAAQLEILVQVCDDVNGTLAYDTDMGLLEEGKDDNLMKILLVGDFCQLPPVSGNFAFEAPPWFRFKSLRLEKIWRQDDRPFIEALQHVRRGHGELAVETFRGNFAKEMDLHYPGATILARNDAVDRMNFLRHREVQGKLCEVQTMRSGEQEKDWTRLIPDKVQIKEGALVMILANRPHVKDDPYELTTFEYVNGDLATVIGQEGTRIKVLLHRTLEETWVSMVTKEKKKATGKKNPRWDILGAVTYMPLRLAYATTVHKSQGLTLDNVQVALKDGFFASPGMLYVALSRARTQQGLRIVGTEQQFVGRCGVHEKVQEWL